MCGGFPNYNPLAGKQSRDDGKITDPNDPEVEGVVREFQEFITEYEVMDPAGQPFDLEEINAMVDRAESGEITWAEAAVTIAQNLKSLFDSEREPQLVGAAIYNPRTGELVEVPLDQVGGMLFGDQRVEDRSNGFLNVPSF